MARRSNDVTVRSGTSERNWYYLAIYVAVGLLAVLATLVSAASTWGTPQFSETWGSTLGLGITVVAIGGIIIYPSLFRDSAYVRDTRTRWKPQWWYYLGGALAVPVAVFFVVNAVYSPALAFILAVISHSFSASIAAGLYLYRRHSFVGVP